MVNRQAKKGKRPKGRFSVLSIFSPAVYRGAAKVNRLHNGLEIQLRPRRPAVPIRALICARSLQERYDDY